MKTPTKRPKGQLRKTPEGPRRKPTVQLPWNKFLPRLVSVVAASLGVASDAKTVKLVEHLHAERYASAVALAGSIAQQQYGNSAEHFAWNQLASLVRKVPFKDPLLQPRETAWKKFLQAEERCAEVNRGVDLWPYHELVEKARNYIVRVIGEQPDLDAIYDACDFGGGASVGVKGTESHVGQKLTGRRWTVTPTARPYAIRALMRNHQIYRYISDPECKRAVICLDHQKVQAAIEKRMMLVGYNNVAFVAKTAETDRSIAVEPMLNGFLQKGVDIYLKRKLARYGHDLRHGHKYNAQLARLGSIQASTGDPNPICTLDLTSASDTIAIKTVKALLPPLWFDFLNDIRSPAYRLGDTYRRYEKFCSMGNGFCFPLETLIFASLAYACGASTGRWAIFGDDIILHRRAALQLVPLLERLGFEVNENKTFIWGNFRESCGADYFAGKNVRPHVLDELPETHKELIKLANGLGQKGLKQALLFCHDNIVPEKRYCRPYDGPPDEAITVPLDVFMMSKFARWDSDLQTWGWTKSTSRPAIDRRTYPSQVYMIGALRGNAANASGLPEFAFRA